MDTKTFKRIARTLKVVYAELEQEALKAGISLNSEIYDKLVYNARLKVLENEGFTLEQYREAKAKVSGFSQADHLDAIEQTGDRVKEIGDRHIPTSEEIESIAERVAQKYIVPPQIINKIVDRVTIEKPKIVKQTVKVREEYNDKPIKKEIEKLFDKINEIKTPEIPDLEKWTGNLRDEFEQNLHDSISIKWKQEMPDFRKLAMGLQQQISDLGTGGYTNLTQFKSQTNWRVFYSNGSGDVIELGLGADGTYLESNGAAAIPGWSVPAGNGDVLRVGTPVNNQVGVWTGDGTLEGDAALTFDTATDTLATTLITATTVTAALVGNASTATLAATVTVVDSTDATSFIAMFDSATGSLAIKTDLGLTYASDTGILTATGFAGPLVGNVTGNVTGTSGSATGNAGTVTVADAGGDTTTWVLLGTSQTGSLAPATDDTLTYNATTGALSTTTFIGALTGNASTATNVAVGGITGAGTGVLTALAVNVGSAGAFITFNGDAGTPSALVGTNLSGTGASFTAGVATLANTVASANEATDTTCFPLFITASGTQTLATKNNAGFIYNSNTNALTATTFIGALTGTASGNLVSGGDAGTPSAIVLTNATGTAASLTAGNATLAATVASANEATDTTCFILFQTASGTTSLATKNNVGLTYNSNTNAVGATTFVGALTGNASTVTGFSPTAGKTLSVVKTMSLTAADDTGVYTLPTGTKTLLATDGAGTSLTGIPYSLTGTANQVTLSAATGNITFTLPNDLRITSASVGTNADSIPTLSSTSTLTNKTLTSPTLTTPSAFTTGGTITLAENTSIALDPAGSADGKYTGITVTGTGGAVIAFGDLVTLDKDDSRWELVDISVAAAATGDARGIIGIAVTSSSDGGALTVLLQGIIRADSNFPALTIGASVYASTTGDIVVAQPSTVDYVIRVVGFAMTADEIYFNPSNDYITHT